MMKSLSPIKNLIKTNPLSITIDNFQAKINYKVTTVILLVASVLVTTEEYIGEHIKCLSDKGVENKVLNTFCYFTTTFSVVSHFYSLIITKYFRSRVFHDGTNQI